MAVAVVSEQPDEAPASPAASEDGVERKAVAQTESGRDNLPAQPEVAPESDSEQEDEIRPGSLRMDSRVGEELYGAQFSATYSHLNIRGVNALGNNNTIRVISYEGQPPAKPIMRDLVGVIDLLKVYAGAAADEELGAILGGRSTACLAGRPNTGRFSTACVALARRHSADHVHEVLLPAEVGPEVLHRAADSLMEGHGYVLRLPGDGHVEAMRRLADVFRRRSASLLLQGCSGLARRRPAKRGGTAPAPRPGGGLPWHLRHQLRDHWELTAEKSAWHVVRYLQQGDLERALQSTYGPREVVPIARDVAERHPADDETLAQILRSSQPRRRARAAEILRSDGAGDGRRPRRADQHERAFRIAYAVFASHPLHYVFEAASLLLEEIDGGPSGRTGVGWRCSIQCPSC